LDVIEEKLSGKSFYQDIHFGRITDYICLEIPAEHITEICKTLKDECGFNLLVDIVGIDRFSNNDRFELIYNLRASNKKERIFLRVKLNSKRPEIESVSRFWSTANWEEREAYDMFGINFRNHPDLRRIYMRDDYDYYPLRKDYPLMGLPGAVELPKK
jgi:NADH-quinone oxidoreductase subunit C